MNRRQLIAALAGGASAAWGQSALPNIGLKAEGGPRRTECGVGALMPWADSLWAITYNSHMEGTGYGLGLYRIGNDMKAERVHIHNGTYANRLVHRESDQVFIGPYAIDLKGNFRFIDFYRKHRITATMRHLTDPANLVYQMTMEGQLYEMDVKTLESKLVADLVKDLKIAARPHFKGGHTAQGRTVVANNGFYKYGENDAGLFEFDGKRWNKLSGKPHMECAGRYNMGEVMFCTGWDESSTLFWALVEGKWQKYRLPRGSHAFMQAWQTEWMRIREIETEHFMMDMHGLFFELQPHAFEGGIWGVKPVCQHLRIIPDYCAWNGLMVLGGNQTSPNQDANPVAGQPQAGIWFGKTDDLWSWGKPQGWGGPWRRASVKKDQPSDPFLMTGFDKKVLHLKSVPGGEYRVEVDFLGNGEWDEYKRLAVSGYAHHEFPAGFSAHWVRIVPLQDATASAEFMYT